MSSMAINITRHKRHVFFVAISIIFVTVILRKQNVDNCKVNTVLYSVNDENLLSPQQIKFVMRHVHHIKTIPLMVTLVNDGYIPIALNWLCHTEHFSIHNQILVITTDQKVMEQLSQASPNITIVVLGSNFITGDQKHGHVGYIRLLLWRTQILNELVQNGIQTLLFEFDSIWFKNPLQLLFSYNSSADMLCVKNYNNPGTVNGGFFYLFPTYSTKMVFRKLLSMLNQLYSKYNHLDFQCRLPTEDNDQEMLSRLIAMKYSNISVVMLSYNDFSDGVWYGMKNTTRSQIQPYIIHNDYIVGNKQKIKRFKSFGHWFISDDITPSCNHKQVTKLLN